MSTDSLFNTYFDSIKLSGQKIVRLACNNVVWLTPDHILDAVRKYFGGRIPLDPATEPNNPTDAEFYGCEFKIHNDRCLGNGLAINWSKFDGIFVNPPYGKVIRRWCKRIYEEANNGAKILALLPAGARFSTQYFQDYILSNKLNAMCFIRGRVKFKNGKNMKTFDNNPYDSIIYGYNVDTPKFCKCFQSLGKVLTIKSCK